MNREMPMAARSTSTQFNTCQPHPLLPVKERKTQTHAHAGVPLVCLCFCLWAFVPNQAPGIFWESRLHQWGPLDCHMSGCRPIPITANWSKAKGKYGPWTSQSNMHPCCLLRAHARTCTHSMWPYEQPSADQIFQKAMFFLLFSGTIEIHCRLKLDPLSPDCCNVA